MAISQTVNFRRHARLQHVLQFARGLQILVHALLALGDLLIEARILNRAGDLRRQQRKRPLVIFGEEAEARAFDVQHADNAILHDQRRRQSPTERRHAPRCSAGRATCSITRIASLRRGGGAGDALARWECCRP